MPERLPEHIARLVASSIESIERLDVLLHLRADVGHTYTARAVAAALHLPTKTVDDHLAVLCGRGFLTVQIGSDLLYSFHPVSPAIAAALGELAELNRTRRSDVVAVLRERSVTTTGAFANALVVDKNRRD